MYGVRCSKRKRRADPNSPGDGLEHIHVFPTLNSHSIHTQSAVRDEDWYSDLSGKVPGGQMGAAQMCSVTNGDPGQAYSRGSATIWRLDLKLLSVNTEESWCRENNGSKLADHVENGGRKSSDFLGPVTRDAIATHYPLDVSHHLGWLWSHIVANRTTLLFLSPNSHFHWAMDQWRIAPLGDGDVGKTALAGAFIVANRMRFIEVLVPPAGQVTESLQNQFLV
ncbi:hypothetical protein DFH09DRAFT_1068658 [Mycena vulgaris]|nr:hypothetical protein DFH09DRAFT_1068658 [Mycena vulgaris]